MKTALMPAGVADDLQGLAADFERELLDTVQDPYSASPEQVRRIELWRRLVLLLERVERGGSASVDGDEDCVQHRHLAGARRVTSHHAVAAEPCVTSPLIDLGRSTIGNTADRLASPRVALPPVATTGTSYLRGAEL